MQLKDLETLSLWDQNYNAGDIEAVAASIEAFGFNQGVAEWHGVIMAGNTRIKALRLLKQRGKIPNGGDAIRITGGEWLVTVFDVSHLDQPAARAYAVADNKTAALAKHNDELLAAILIDLSRDNESLFAATGYTPDELTALIQSVAAAKDDTGETHVVGGDPGSTMRRFDEWADKWQPQRGDVWVIPSKTGGGSHRLMYGDSYSDADRARLTGGARINLAHFDPPYGINAVQWRGGDETHLDSQTEQTKADHGSIGNPRRKHSPKSTILGHKQSTPDQSGVAVGRVHGVNSGAAIVQSKIYPVIQGDDRQFDPASFLDLADNTILWGGNYYAHLLPPKSCWIIWDKREQITRNSFADCEIAWTSMDSPARIFAHLWNGLHKGSQVGEGRIHPSEKPIALYAEIGNEYAPRGTWLDLFGGSGSQLVAAERNGATCYMMEIEPLYIAAILERISREGVTPVKDSANGL